ncbi:MAG: UDP-N-acetylglucosamine 2-epimerase (non-hydrolyzing) [Defluviitaleaceae bacterium]|nr:UDP-N-acetylglucosamine 2-epimerase (non-hydrolyzing) [Defluviitaleaceae bacterium]
MEKLKVLCAFGTRPEAIKMSPLVLALKKHEDIETRVLVSAQHRELLDSVMDIFGIKPDADLDIMQSGQTLTDITTRILIGAGKHFDTYKPDIVLVHGDTSTTFATALAAFYAGIKVGHVEAGLRTFNKLEPFPEEMNRLLTGRIADVHFSPTQAARRNLIKEGIDASSVYVTGNTEIDALTNILTRNKGNYMYKREEINAFERRGRLIVMTAHRRENLGQPMEEICGAMLDIINENADTTMIWPVHPNPKVREVAHRVLGGHERILLTDAVDNEDMYNLANEAFILATESAGLQEISPYLNKPCVVLRNVTERPEGVDTGALMIGGNSYGTVYAAVDAVLNNESVYAKMAAAANPFGDGRASERIIAGILHYFKRVIERPTDFS